MEKMFQLVFVLAVITAAIIAIGLFLLVIKLLLLANPEVYFWGLTIS
jgi:hypothetical protein